MELIVGAVYRNRNGSDYRCLEVYGGLACMERVTDRWTLIAHGVRQYANGTIEWDYSSGGRWPIWTH